MEKNTALESLSEAYAAMLKAQVATERAVHAARATGASWADVASRLNITRQAAQQRYSKSSPELIAADRLEDRAAIAAYEAANTDTKPETPSIFVAPQAPAKAAKPSTKVAPKAPAKTRAQMFGLVLALTSDWDKREEDPSYPAQPGTGKGPHQCPRCEQTNHHSNQFGKIEFFPECTPTRYDPPATVDAIAEWHKTN